MNRSSIVLRDKIVIGNAFVAFSRSIQYSTIPTLNIRTLTSVFFAALPNDKVKLLYSTLATSVLGFPSENHMAPILPLKFRQFGRNFGQIINSSSILIPTLPHITLIINLRRVSLPCGRVANITFLKLDHQSILRNF